jgi:hypothetical protein
MVVSSRVSWATSSLHTWPGSDEKHKPIMIKQCALGANLPTSDFMVSPQHHIVMKGALCVELFGVDEVLARAIGLTGLAGLRVMAGKKEADYFRLMMERHEILIAQGVETESFYLGLTSLHLLTVGQRASFLAVVPTLPDDPENGYGPTAHKKIWKMKITRHQAEQLVEAMKCAAKKTEAFADQTPIMLKCSGFADLAAVRKNFILNKIPECTDPFGLAQFLGIGQKHRHFAAFKVRQNSYKVGEILGHIVWQNTNADIAQNRLKYPEVVVHC